MTPTPRSAFQLEIILKRSWPFLVAGAVLVLGFAGIIYSLVVSGKTRGQDAYVPPSSASTTTDVVMDMMPRRLDGVLVPTGQEALMPYAVMVENSPDARPLSGVARASIAVEAPVEGGITRFMLVFDATTTMEQVGPVRSARPYFVELADALKAVYAHVGGSPEALERIATISGFRNLDEFSNGSTFWRSQQRAAPHNVYTNQTRLAAATQKKLWEAASFTPWRYLTTTSVDPGGVSTISVPYGGTFNVTWTYDAEHNRYIRKQAGSIQKDLDGTVVSTTNVLVLRSEEQVLDSYGRLKIRTTGTGRGVLFRDGKRFDLTWRRTAGSWFTFESTEGGDILFRPGQTWISIVTEASQFPANLESATSTTNVY